MSAFTIAIVLGLDEGLMEFWPVGATGHIIIIIAGSRDPIVSSSLSDA